MTSVQKLFDRIRLRCKRELKTSVAYNELLARGHARNRISARSHGDGQQGGGGALFKGMKVRVAAAATGHRESTIGPRVTHMFAKHGLSRQADRVRLVPSLSGAPESGRC